MRILHTSDWHLGRTFHGHSTHEALSGVLAALPDLVREHDVDVVVVAGDVFDSSVPSAESLQTLERVLLGLRDTGATIVVISGNHDSPTRLGFQSVWAERAGVHVRTHPERLDEPVVVADAHGDVELYPVPFLEPALLRHRVGDVPMASQADALRWALGRVHAAVEQRRGALADSGAAGGPAATRAVVVSHCFAVGVSPEAPTIDVERDITAGGIDLVPLDVFDGIDLTLLGHVHGRAELSPRVRYSGAPLHFSFSEARKPRGAWLIDLGPRRPGSDDELAEVAATWVDLPVPRPLAELRGTLRELLDDAAHEFARDHWVKAVVTDSIRPLDSMRRLQTRFAHCALLEFDPEDRAHRTGATYGQRVRGARGDVDLVNAFLEHVRGAGLDEHERGVVVDALADLDGAGR
ncbi:exonuclease SbcCD subunit D [Pseudoclavibacter endophyticus]|uniref:Nuclease SbcCD subunit D n=1 Tax=Pseudoclavibacter endophyticus TaxID=1778590 RepID=A0A6H9WUU6_9MICO|nr:exonuclease SbcCD subunit D [Pseudoclavibacter endophyticus]KAB1650274.1 exonuclease SbcCD subunit D [Pseudoclavibacter endophyticus]